MKRIRIYLLSVVCVMILGMMSCGGGQDNNENQTDSSKISQPENNTTTVSMDLSAGQKIYKEKCMVCHQESGLGVPGTFPPLANSDYLKADKSRALHQAIYGSKEPITVNGIQYPGKIMTVFEKELNDQQVMDVVNYVLNSWGNSLGTVTLDDVKTARAKK